MDKDLYDRQQEIKINLPNAVTVVGLGGTGSWVALFLAMSGVERLHLMDFDNLDMSNFNRLPYPLDELGNKKTDSAERFIASLRPDCIIIKHGKATAFSLELTEGELLFDCTDSQETQQFLFKWCKEHGRKYIRDGYNGGSHITVTDHAAMWYRGEPKTGYEIEPSWVIPAALAGCLGVAKALYCPNLNLTTDITKIGEKAK